MTVGLALAALAGGCALYGGGTSDDVMVCGADPGPALRDPQTGTCETFGGCRGIPDPDWAVCGDPCEPLAEGACLTAPGCRAIYGVPCTPGGSCPPGVPPTFVACWGTAPASTTEGGGCDGLDAFGCSQHDDCAGLYDQYETGSPLAQALLFDACIAEPALGAARGSARGPAAGRGL